MIDDLFGYRRRWTKIARDQQVIYILIYLLLKHPVSLNFVVTMFKMQEIHLTMH